MSEPPSLWEVEWSDGRRTIAEAVDRLWPGASTDGAAVTFPRVAWIATPADPRAPADRATANRQEARNE